MAAPFSVNELSDAYAEISYFDINGNAYTPLAVSWRLWDDTNKVSIQNWTPIATPGTSNTVDIPAALNTIGNPAHLTEIRKVIFFITVPGGGSRYDQVTYSLIAIPDIP
jgi:hypothetical protein